MSRIIRIQAENFKRLVAIDITPDGNVVVLSGANRQGKTSILDAIYAVLKGAKFAKETSNAIRSGEDEAWVRLEIGDDADHVDYVATRRWTKDDGGTLTVESANKAKYSGPQGLLDEIVGEVSFDPQQFIDMKTADQVDALVTALGDALPFKPAELAAKRKGIYDRRTEVGRDVTKLEGQLAGFAATDSSLPDVEESASGLLAEAETAREHNASIDTVINAGDRIQGRVERALEALKAAQAEHETAYAAYGDWRKQVDELPERIDTSAIGERLANLEQTNAKVRAQQNRKAVAAELSDRKAEVAQFTLALQKIDKQKADGIAAAKFPVPELSFNDDGVTYNGRAFSQASTEEQMRAAFGVAIVANPKLRVCRIDKGEALDTESLKVLAALADEYEMQVWLSRVDESGSIGFVIEDGGVRS